MTYSRRYSKSRTNLGLGFIAFVAGLLLLAWLWRQAAASQWPGGGDFSWVEQPGDDLTVHTFLPEYAKLIHWQIPGNTLVETAFGYGRYQWKNVFSLGELDGRGAEVLARTSQENLGLVVKTNLSWWDKLKWWLIQLKTNQRLTINLVASGAWQPETLPDGSEVFVIDEYQLDQIVNQETFSQKIAGEGLSVSLVNDQGLGRVIKNHGINLVSLSRSEADEKTLIYLKEAQLRESETVAWLKRLLPQAEVRIGSGDSWSAIVIILGRDYNSDTVSQ